MANINFMMPPLVSYETTSAEQVQKSHADDASYQGSASDWKKLIFNQSEALHIPRLLP